MQTRPLIPARIRVLQTTLLVACGLLTFALLSFPFTLRPTSVTVDVGDVAPRDLQAPRDIEYVSEVRTEEARQAAERSVPPVYAPVESSIARQQIERMRTVLQYITLVRDDPHSTPEQKKADLAAISDIHLSEAVIQQIFALPAARWDAVQQEALSVLEQIMRNAVRLDNLDSIQRGIITRVSLSFPEDQARLVADLVLAFIVPNSLYSAELTDAARQTARDGVEPYVQRYKAGETVVAGGQIFPLIRFAMPQ